MTGADDDGKISESEVRSLTQQNIRIAGWLARRQACVPVFLIPAQLVRWAKLTLWPAGQGNFLCLSGLIYSWSNIDRSKLTHWQKKYANQLLAQLIKVLLMSLGWYDRSLQRLIWMSIRIRPIVWNESEIRTSCKLYHSCHPWSRNFAPSLCLVKHPLMACWDLVMIGS